MSRDEQIINYFVDSFGSYKDYKFKDNLYVTITDDFINEYISIYEGHININLTEDEKTIIINKIKSIYSIYQEEGDVILGNYNHNYDWYKNWLKSENYKDYFWSRYRNYLLKTKHFPSEGVSFLERDTLYNLMSYLGNPNEEAPFSIRGLVVGDVQSGKTSNYIGLITKAADAGYKVIFILTGTIESLRRQTQQRVEEGFIGYDSVHGCDVGVGRGDPTPKSFTSREKDFISNDNQNTTYKLSDYSKEPMIFVLKKNVNVLQKVYSSLKNINTSVNHKKIDYPALVIDDEADNASINTNKPENDPTKINKLIRNLLSLFTRTSYVGFTATPFANVFISYDKEDEMLKDDLFPRDFIYSLKSPSNYCGPKTYFMENNENIHFIDDSNDDIFPMNHKKEWEGDTLFDSLYYAIRCFLIANTIRDIRDINKKTHRSMLINMSRFKLVQSKIMDIVEEYFNEVKRMIKLTHKLPMDQALTNPTICSLKETFEKEYKQIDEENITWEKIFEKIYDSISTIKIVVVNSGNNSTKLNYNDAKDGLRVIAVGGLALSRGLTLEGLMISYFYRNTSTFDVLMQMGRWFGYRDGYKDLCRIWLTRESYNYYKYIYESTEALKQDIKTMGQERRKPEDFGIRVRNDSIELGIIAPNKMRNTMVKCVRKSFYGSLFETPYILRELNLIEENIDNTLKFLDKIDLKQRDSSIKPPYFRNVEFSKVMTLLEELNISKTGDVYFDKAQIVNFMKKNEHNLGLFDVLIMNGEQIINGEPNPNRFKFKNLNIDIPLVSRKIDIRDQDIRISKSRLRLGGRTDTMYGISQEQRPLTNTKAQDYLIKERNPLLIIYFIRPSLSEESDEEKYVSDKEPESDTIDVIKLHNELKTRKYQYLVGYALGFPQRDGNTSETIMYTVNKTVNYYDMEHNDECDEE